MNKEFPKWKYHEQHAPRLVADPRDEAALGDEWADSPALLDSKSSPANEARENKPRKQKQ